MKDMVAMYQNGGNDYGDANDYGQDSPVKSKTLVQKDLGNGLAANGS
jgi:hypothetical protein